MASACASKALSDCLRGCGLVFGGVGVEGSGFGGVGVEGGVWGLGSGVKCGGWGAGFKIN